MMPEQHPAKQSTSSGTPTSKREMTLAEKVAERVYQLLMEDARRERERRG
jgi:hypothetical protein